MFRRRWVRGLFYVAGTFIFLKIKDNFSASYRLGWRCGDADGFIVLLPPCMITIVDAALSAIPERFKIP